MFMGRIFEKSLDGGGVFWRRGWYNGTLQLTKNVQVLQGTGSWYNETRGWYNGKGGGIMGQRGWYNGIL